MLNYIGSWFSDARYQKSGPSGADLRHNENELLIDSGDYFITTMREL